MKIFPLSMMLLSCFSGAEVLTKIGSNGYLTLVNNIGYQYTMVSGRCSDSQYEMYLLTNAISDIYDDYRSDVLSTKYKGFRINFIQGKTTTDDQGNEKESIQTILRFEISRSSFAKINKSFGSDISTRKLLRGFSCSPSGPLEGILRMSDLDKYLHVFTANGGKITYNSEVWGTPIPNAKRF